ncbi:hypothetical protein [Streptomyces sp. NPDC052114]|uniref:hypothetical protein n=1 Tax=unclassified Streptomyces TaxID=2593676 RepID=UPI00341312DE
MKRVRCETSPPRADASSQWSERELRLVERLATVHHELGRLRRERTALVSYVWRLHGGSVGLPGPDGGRMVHVDTAAGSLSWHVDAEDTDLLYESGRRTPSSAGETAETLTRLSFLHLHRRPNLPTRSKRAAAAAVGDRPSE